MIDFLKSFKSLVKSEDIRTDNNVFKLHYKFTVIMLIVFSLLLSSKQYFGEPINCLADKDQDIFNTYCWVFGTYILKSTATDKILAGMGPDRINYLETNQEDHLWQKYYQWVCLVFCFQALLFYLPRYVWKTWEGGRLRLLVKDLNEPLVSSKWNKRMKKELVEYLLSGRHSHNLYAFRYTVCELLNLINVISQIALMDWFLTGNFTFYGIAVAAFQESNPMGRVFPKMAKCRMHTYGPSGSLMVRDALCVLPLNMLNENLFLILWFWLLILTVVTIFSMIYRILVVRLRKLRVYLMMAQVRFLGIKQVESIMADLSYGDFFVLYHIGKNVNPVVFKDIVLEMYHTIHPKARIGFAGDVDTV